MKNKKIMISLFTILSVMIHYFLLDIPLDRLKTNKVSKLRIKSIKTIGEIDKKKPGVFLKEKPIKFPSLELSRSKQLVK